MGRTESHLREMHGAKLIHWNGAVGCRLSNPHVK